jgi:hypothetical protein
MGWRAPGVAIIAVGLIGAALFTVARINLSSTADTSIPAPGPPTSASPKDFSDGLGIYFFNEGKYNFLTWRSKLYTPGTIPDEKAMLEISQRAARVKKDVRFFSYGIDISTWPGVPPYLMAFCIVRDFKTIDGIYPVRITPVDRNQGPIYELLLPPVADGLRSGNLTHLFWAINFQYSCTEGWAFRFE